MIACTTAGMLVIGKMKPERMKVGRKLREQRQLERHLLVGRHRGDEQPLPLRADQEQADRQAQQPPRAALRQVEQRHADQDDQQRRGERDHRVGQGLAEHERQRVTGAMRICSMVPRSFSRTTASAVEITAVIIEM